MKFWLTETLGLRELNSSRVYLLIWRKKNPKCLLICCDYEFYWRFHKRWRYGARKSELHSTKNLYKAFQIDQLAKITCFTSGCHIFLYLWRTSYRSDWNLTVILVFLKSVFLRYILFSNSAHCTVIFIAIFESSGPCILPHNTLSFLMWFLTWFSIWLISSNSFGLFRDRLEFKRWQFKSA